MKLVNNVLSRNQSGYSGITDILTTELPNIPVKSSTNDLLNKGEPQNNFSVLRKKSKSFDYKHLLIWSMAALGGAILVEILILLTSSK